jgi:YidC/Oxa1 family membrane protein insertase
MEMWRKHNVHPLGGCLPILLQMPIFIGLYFSLQESVHFRLGKFLWIQNLAAPDMLIGWGQAIPIIADPNGQGGVVMDKGFMAWLATVPNFLYLGPFFNLLPVIAVTFMIIQQKVMTPPPQDEQQAAQFKMMRYMMVVFGLMFYKVAAGLAMYIIISTVWGLAERRFLPKKQTAAAPQQAIPVPTGGPRAGPSGRKQPVRKVPEKKEGNVQKVKDWWQEVLRQAKKK